MWNSLCLHDDSFHPLPVNSCLLILFWTTFHGISSVCSNYEAVEHGHKFSIKFRSGDWMCHFNRLIVFVFFFKSQFDCIGEIFGIAVLLKYTTELHLYRFDWCVNLLIYSVLLHGFILLSIICIHPVSSNEKHSHTIPLPLPCFTVVHWFEFFILLPVNLMMWI